jgi:hypothetical protein
MNDTIRSTTNETAARVRIGPSTADRVERLREVALNEPDIAQDAAWAWIAHLGQLTDRDHTRGVEQIERLFEQGQVPAPLEGEAEGMMVAYMVAKPVDFMMRKIGAVWMPWLGKRFDAERERGENRITNEFGFFTRAIWPTYSTRRGEGERRGFEFETRVDRGAIEPAVPVLVVDYSRVPQNPRRIVPSIRDELVQIVPGIHLGRWLYRRPNDQWKNVAYFALRTESH